MEPSEAELGIAESCPRRAVYCRLPGLLAYVAAEGRAVGGHVVPIVVAEERIVRDASSAAITSGVRVGQGVTAARRSCPAALVVPLSELDYRPSLRLLLDALADVSPVVEPAEPDGAYADLSACGGRASLPSLVRRIRCAVPFASVIVGEGRSRLAARACAECGLPPHRLAEASVQWLIDDPATLARLLRLGLSTFGAVAELPESALVYQFGSKAGRLLHRRAGGADFTPVRPLYPPPRVDLCRDFTLEPVDDRGRYHMALQRLAEAASCQLREQGLYGRRVRLVVRTERGEECQKEEVPATPVQKAGELASAARRLSEQLRLSAAVVGIRLLVEDLEVPAAVTHSLFEEREVKSLARLEAARRRLVVRFGSRSLMRLRDIPISVREQRRSLIREMRGGL